MDELIRNFDRDYNVRAIGSKVLKCRDKALKREGECP
jgi:hypothetical protein